MEKWKFNDPENVAVITSKKIAAEGEWIKHVSHDEDDGAWQFHSSEGGAIEAEAVLVSLRSIVQADPSIELLADLPIGWHAWRDSRDSEWQREQIMS